MKGVPSQYHIIKILDKYNIERNLLTIYRLFTFIFILFFLFNEKRFSLHFRFVSYFLLLTIFILNFSPARTFHIQLHDLRTMVRKMRMLMTMIRRTGCWGGFACPCFAVATATATDDNDKDVEMRLMRLSVMYTQGRMMMLMKKGFFFSQVHQMKTK